MVAITVILAAVISVFVLSVGESVQNPAPGADFNFEYDEVNGSVNVVHASGDSINGDQLRFSGAALEKTSYGSITEWAGGEVIAGDSATVNVEGGETLEITWQNEDGTTSATLATYEVPDGASASGSITNVDANAASDEVLITVSSLDQFSGSEGYVVVENTNTGDTAESTIQSSSTESISLPSIDAGHTVRATLYESSSKSNQLESSVSDTTASASIDTLTSNNPEIDLEVSYSNAGGSVTVEIESVNANGGGNTIGSKTIDYSPSGDKKTISTSAVSGDRVDVTVYETPDKKNELDSDSVSF